MRYLLSGPILFIGGLSSVTFGLSCISPLPTFDNLYDNAPVAFRGVLIDATLDADMQEEQICLDMGADPDQLGVHTLVFDVEESFKGDLGDQVAVTREVTGIHCTWGGGCVDLQPGETYVVVAEEDLTLQDGLCKPCPYILASEFTPPPASCICPMIYAPVCGSNGETYGNECQLNCAQVDKISDGECIPDQPLCACTKEYMPVCGTDGKSYGNACELACAGTDKAYDGNCTDPLDEIPAHCVSRYDGCNTCMVTNGQIGGCTKKACFTTDQPRCLGFSFNHLQVADQLFISAHLEKYFNKLNPADLATLKETALARIADKRADIQYTLATSSFVVGSPELIAYTFALEVLDFLESLLVQ